MRFPTFIAAPALAVALLAWGGEDAFGQPRPPPPPGGGGSPRPAVGLYNRPPPGRGISSPGGIGSTGRVPADFGGPGPRRGVSGAAGGGTRGLGGPGRPNSIGPGGTGAPRASGGPMHPGGSGRARRFPEFGGLGALARSNGAPGSSPTVAINQQALARQGDLVRNNFNFNQNYFQGDWWRHYPRAWRAASWAAARAAYSTPTWSTCYSYGGYASEPLYYDYGSNVVYEREYVYVNGDPLATREDYAEQAKTIADTGGRARVSTDEPWLPLGVFAVVQGEQANGNDLFQLAVNKSGVIRGNYYNALSDTTLPVCGSVDKASQRAAWTIGDRQSPVIEAGYANLTKSETPILVHFAKERTQQWTLVRINRSEEPE